MISITGSILGVINSFTWLFWGCVSMNEELNLLHVVVANVLGLIICICQVAVYYYYKNKNKQLGIPVVNSGAEEEDKTIRKISVVSANRNPNDPAIFEF